ncbi:histone H1 Ecym_8315 [Eremothecium cymbalariae DBVPG|uniref:Histone H1 n=1 Tax=Eremothecium cymbalariae (strain CBS 270.75 / DBVPG 7215 / KCTC 17166 / NRRL Y-17582) TaxID=931890 RepID=G8JXL9_ERECY|nr:Hypothetical protein Ecym_8315 [Eremothecium cymbalariae DBVPG\
MATKSSMSSNAGGISKKVAKSSGSPLPKYKDLIVEAVLGLGERGGSSRQALKKYIKDKYAVGSNFDGQFNLAVKRGLEAGELSQPKGPAGSIKLLKKAVASNSVSKPAEKKVTKKKVASVKKVSGKKVATKKAVTKKPAASSSAAAKKSTAKKSAASAAALKKTTAKKPVAGKRSAATSKKPASKRAAKSA